ncbi:MAG: hypothetical protein ACRD2N_22415, partial [Vicinamibacterales bacterium]
PSTVDPTLPAPIEWTIERCLAKDPRDRYTATRDLARELETVRHHLVDLDRAREPAIETATNARRKLGVLAAMAAALLVGVGMSHLWLRSNQTPSTTPTFKQLTFRRGYVENAKFAPNGDTIVYSAAWDGGPMGLFETLSSGPESRTVKLAVPAGIGSISSSNELAVVLGCRLDWGRCRGTLATMPLSGGAPRELLEDVEVAAWAPDGVNAVRASLGARVGPVQRRHRGCRRSERPAGSARGIAVAAGDHLDRLQAHKVRGG